MIRIAIVDDHVLIREGLKKVIQNHSDLIVVGEADNVYDAVLLVVKNEVDVVVLDINLQGRNGLEALEKLKEVRPKLPVLILTLHPAERFAILALKGGASGYLTKESAAEELVQAIRKVAGRGKYVTPVVAELLATGVERDTDKLPHQKLSVRELQVLCMIAFGKSVLQIADELSLSMSTVNSYRSRILEKMNLKSNSDLIRYGIQNKLVD